MAPDPAQVGSRFCIEGRFLSAEPWGSGHINRSFLVTGDRGGAPARYLLQRINRTVFPDVAALMENIRRVLDHLHGRLAERGAADPERRALTLVPARDGASWWTDEDGEAWRCYLFVPDTVTHDTARDAAHVREAARAFGEFQALLADLPGDPLQVTIPGFHDTRARLAALREAAAGDPHGRAGHCAAEIDTALSREADCGLLADALAAGEIPERACHYDTKINNVLFDTETGEGLCVVDLDTLMPGSVLYDFGDLIRSSTNPSPEDQSAGRRTGIRADLCRAVAAGYLGPLRSLLAPREWELLPAACRIVPLELGARFLTDHLLGDRYFRIHREGQNLDRARAQFAIAGSAEAQAGRLAAITREVRAG